MWECESDGQCPTVRVDISHQDLAEDRDVLPNRHYDSPYSSAILLSCAGPILVTREEIPEPLAVSLVFVQSGVDQRQDVWLVGVDEREHICLVRPKARNVCCDCNEGCDSSRGFSRVSCALGIICMNSWERWGWGGRRLVALEEAGDKRLAVIFLFLLDG